MIEWVFLTYILLYFVYLSISMTYFDNCCVQNNIYLACKKGYNGTDCKQKCPFPSYGLGCQRKCNCIDKVCDHINGCMQPTRYTFVNKGNIFVIISNLNEFLNASLSWNNSLEYQAKSVCRKVYQ